MRYKNFVYLGASFVTLIWALSPIAVQARVLEEIVVMAQKRAQSVNDVPISIKALEGETLKDFGVLEITDLARFTPGFSVNPASASTAPVYTLRGIGYTDSSLQADPTVGIYLDNIPIPHSIMSSGALFDMERVEVLKGPQGTLYGVNTTGGAVNVFSNRPTDEFEAGFTATYGRFETFEGEGYVSGPLSDNLKARLAVTHVGSSEGWQQSVSRPGDDLGEQDRTAARLLVDFEPSEDWTFEFGAHWWKDQSDQTAALAIARDIQNPGSIAEPILLAIDLAEDRINDNRAADWVANGRFPVERDFEYKSFSIRASWDINDSISVTSMSSYSEFEDSGTYFPYDGTGGIAPADIIPARNYRFTGEITNLLTTGDIETFTQELQLSGSTENVNWIIGGYYGRSDTEESNFSLGDVNTRGIIAPVFGLFLKSVDARGKQDSETYAVFGQADWQFSEQFGLSAGLRYTEIKRDFEGCTHDDTFAITEFPGMGAAFFNTVFFGGAPIFDIGDCLTLGAFDPVANPLTFFGTGVFTDTLKEDAVSGRLALNYTPTDDHLIYASFNRGFKGGGFPTVAASSTSQFTPVTKETVDAYEAGFKSTLREGTTQLNGALFYYDYDDKQLQGHVIDPVFSRLIALVNIPKSTVWGAELDFQSNLSDNLEVSGGFTYVNTEVDEYFGIDALAQPQNFKDSPFPLTPEWQANFAVEYSFDISTNIGGFVSADVAYVGDTNTEYTPTGGSPNSLFELPSHAIVGLRFGVESLDGRWRLMAWGRNLFDEDYRISAAGADFIARKSGRPQTYGITLGYKFQ